MKSEIGRGWGGAIHLKVPVEAGEGPVLLALVLQEQRTLVNSELLQVPATHISNGCRVLSTKSFQTTSEGLSRKVKPIYKR